MAGPATATRLALVAYTAMLVGCHVDVISGRDMTATAITETSVRIGLYVEANGELPADLTVIPARQGHMNRTTDGWNRPLSYHVDGDAFTLNSLGRNGVVGGTGDDADWLLKYRVVNGQVAEVP